MSTVLTEKGLKATFLAALAAWPSLYRMLATIIPSNADSEKYAWLGAPPAVREFVNGRVIKRIPETTYSIVNKKWESTLRIEQDDIDDDQLGGLMMRVRQMAEYFERHKDELMLGTVIAGADALLCYDGQYFYDDDHVDPEAEYTTSQDNDLTSDITDPANPTVEEFQTALQGALLALRTFKDSNGKPVNPPGAKIWLEGPACMEYIFHKFMTATFLAITSNGAEDGNMWKGLIGGVIINPYEANADRFRVHVLDGAVKPFIFQDRKATKVQYIQADQQNPDFSAFNEDANFFGVKARYNGGFGDWRKSVLHIFT